MTIAQLLGFLRRELAPTPGRGGATLRLTLACLIATIPILTHRIPLALVVMIFMYLVTQEDTAATLLGSIMAVIGITLGLGLALLALMVSLDLPMLRLTLCAVFLFGGLFLKRVLVVGALGSALGLPAAIILMLPDVASVPHVFAPSPEMLTEFVLWFWLCVALGLAVNLGVQLLLAPGNPLTLLQGELDARLRAAGQAARALAEQGRPAVPVAAALSSLATAGMTRPLSLLKTASLTRAWAHERHEALSAIITLTDRLVTDAAALVAAAPSRAIDAARPRLVRIAEACEQTRRAFAERRRPAPESTVAGGTSERRPSELPVLDDMERVLEQLAVAGRPAAGREPRAGRRLFLPDAFTNPEYVQFAVKGALAALTCYVLFIGFDYPGIYTSVITCFVVALSTIGSSNQKGLLRFGGAAVGGLLGLLALVYALPEVDGIGGFWLVFGAGTAVAAWVNFGSPRIAYGGYQIGVAFYKAVLQGFGPAVSATGVRDRLIGVFVGLIVYGIVETTLWPVRAADRMRQRVADLLDALADLAAGSVANVEAHRARLAQQVTDVQGFIESSRFEPGRDDAERIERTLADAQAVLLILLALARHQRETGSVAPAEEAQRIGTAAATLRAVAGQIRHGISAPAPAPEPPASIAERVSPDDAAADGNATDPEDGLVLLRRHLEAAVERLRFAAAIGSAVPA